jgi:hypothetical protein
MALCKVCSHPDRTVIDRTIAAGSGSIRDIAKKHGLAKSSVLRHAVNHLQPAVMAGVDSVAGSVVKAVRDQQQRERQQVQSVWVQRLDKTYGDAATAYERAMSDPEGIDAAAKFLMVAARLCDTGLRTDGVLAGGGETRVTVNVEQLVVLPTPQTPRQRPEVAEIIDVTPTD